jgi:hypothetical protein
LHIRQIGRAKLNFANHQVLPSDTGDLSECEGKNQYPSLIEHLGLESGISCIAEDYLNAAVVLNGAYASQNVISISAAENVTRLRFNSDKYFMLLNRMVAYFVDNMQSCSIVVSATLEECVGASCHVRFRVTAGQLSALAAQKNRCSALEPKTRTKTNLRDVVTLASILNMPLRANLVEQKKSEMSFSLDALEIQNETIAREKVGLRFASPRLEKLQVLLVSCVESPTSKLVRSLHGENCQVTCIRDVVFAWSTAHSVHFDLVFVDIIPGPIRSEMLFRKVLAERYRKSGGCSMFTFGGPSESCNDRALSMREVLDSIAFEYYVQDRKFSDRSFKPLNRRQQLGPRVQAKQKVIKFAFCHSKLSEHLARVTLEGFAKRAHLFAQQLQWAESTFKSHGVARDLSRHKSELQRLAESAKNFGANEVSDLCQNLGAALQAESVSKVTQHGTVLSEISRVVRSQLLNLVRLICGPSQFECDQHEA